MFFGVLGYGSRDLDFMSLRELTNALNGNTRAKKEHWTILRRLTYVNTIVHLKKNSNFKEDQILSDKFLDPDYKKKPVKLAKVTRIGEENT